MKKLKVTYTPPFAIKISVLILVVIICAEVHFFGEVGLYIGILIGLAAYCIMCKKGTIVEFGNGSIIKCRYFFYKWDIDLEKIDRFSYSIESHLARGGPRYTFDIKFYYSENDVEDYYKLNTSIGREEILKCMEGGVHKLNILQIYRYAENLCPEKAGGYVESSSIF